MKKLLSLFSALVITGASTTVVACGTEPATNNVDPTPDPTPNANIKTIHISNEGAFDPKYNPTSDYYDFDLSFDLSKFKPSFGYRFDYGTICYYVDSTPVDSNITKTKFQESYTVNQPTIGQKPEKVIAILDVFMQKIKNPTILHLELTWKETFRSGDWY